MAKTRTWCTGLAWLLFLGCGSNGSGTPGGAGGARSGGVGGTTAPGGAGGSSIAGAGGMPSGGMAGTTAPGGAGGSTLATTTAGAGGGVTSGGSAGSDAGPTAQGGNIGAADPGGTWVGTASGGSAGKGAGGAGGGTAAVCTPGVAGAIVTGCGYPYSSDVSLTSVDFNESEVLRAIRPSIEAGGGIVSLLYNDEHAMTLGVRRVVVKSAAGTATTDFPVSPLPQSPSSIFDPQTGTNELAGDNSGLDPSLRPLWPVLYVTDVTNNPTSRAGDWQMGGRPINPNAVFGSWKAAVRTVDKTVTPGTVSVTADPDPAKNDWSLTVSDPIPSGIKNEGFSTEVRWSVKFQPGHSYRLQVLVHDGDQNKVGGDSGEACIVFCASGEAPPPICPDATRACGEGLAEGGGYLTCTDEGESCLDGCCTPVACPVGAAPCGQIGAEGGIVGCPADSNCVSGCCIASLPIP